MEIFAKEPHQINADVIITGIFEEERTLNTIQKNLDEKFTGAISKNILEIENFKGKFLETFSLPINIDDNGADGKAAKILAIGLGKKEEFNKHKAREASAKAIKAAEKLSKNKTVAINIQKNEGCAKAAYNVALGAILGEYDFDKYKTKKNEEKINEVEILAGTTEDIKNAVNKAKVVGSAMGFTRDLIFEPAEYATPSKIAEVATKLAGENGLEIKVYGKDELKSMNFNAFLAVGQGSVQEPKFIHLKYIPQGVSAKKKIAIIGKGITFDSGGLDIKPPASMLTMKTDMSGCACVLGVAKAISELKPDVEVHILSALCENMPSGSSYKVGDVITAKNGKTIEVDNTDAEGRLTLADVLTYADELNVDEVIDVATLTGAVIVALGNTITGVMGNDEALIKEIIEDGKEAGEALWQMPILDDMQDNLKSDIADMRNTGSRYAGASVAGRFLQNFTNSKKWVHLDIAGTAFIDKPYKELSKGATAAMVRTLIQHITK